MFAYLGSYTLLTLKVPEKQMKKNTSARFKTVFCQTFNKLKIQRLEEKQISPLIWIYSICKFRYLVLGTSSVNLNYERAFKVKTWEENLVQDGRSSETFRYSL